jgi:hypothetical protein
MSKETILPNPSENPFELSSNLTLESLVKDGYRFGGMPCDQVQFVKQLGDTLIQYEIEVDCNNYGKLIGPSSIFGIKLQTNEFNLDTSSSYYPFNSKQIKRCNNRVVWRYYEISLDSLDIDNIPAFVNRHGGIIIQGMENVKRKTEGNIIVYNFENSLYFDCLLRRKKSLQSNEKSWMLTIARTIPFLDEKERVKDRKRKERIRRYQEQNPFVFED